MKLDKMKNGDIFICAKYRGKTYCSSMSFNGHTWWSLRKILKYLGNSIYSRIAEVSGQREIEIEAIKKLPERGIKRKQLTDCLSAFENNKIPN